MPKPALLLLPVLFAATHAQPLKPIPDKTVILTFDDGVSTHATYVAPAPQKVRLPRHLFRLRIST